MKSINLKYLVPSIIVILFVFQGCKISYSTTGADLGGAETFSVNYFTNNSQLVNPSLSQTLTEAVKDKFISQTSLNLINGVGDLHFEGQITDYKTLPVDIKDDAEAAYSRLTIEISVKFTNIKNSEFDFDTKFSRYADYASELDLSSVEAEKVDEILEQLTEDIFNKSVVNW